MFVLVSVINGLVVIFFVNTRTVIITLYLEYFINYMNIQTVYHGTTEILIDGADERQKWELRAN